MSIVKLFVHGSNLSTSPVNLILCALAKACVAAFILAAYRSLNRSSIIRGDLQDTGSLCPGGEQGKGKDQRLAGR